MTEEIETWHSEYELRQFIDTATRWSIEAVNKNRTKERPYSIFTDDIKNARTNFDLFADQLNKKLISIQNWKAIEIDLEDRFLKMLNQYINWYEENKEETEAFGNYNPYELMLSVIESTKKEILKYFPKTLPISNSAFDLKRFEIEIRKQPSVSDKLDYWRNILSVYIDQPAESLKTKGKDNHEIARLKGKLLSQLFNDYSNSPFFPIPRSIYNEHFSDGLNNPEFTYWFLKYNAKKYFKTTYNIKKLSTKLQSSKAKQHITAELRKLKELEKNADELLLNKTIDIYSPYYDSKYVEEIELLRIKVNYYEENTLPNVNTIGNTTVVLYALHIYLKEYLNPTIQVTHKGFNTAEIAEYTSHKDSTLDHIKLSTLDTVEGFSVYLSKIDNAEDYFISSNFDLNNGSINDLFEEYFQRTFSKYKTKTKTLFRLNEKDFKEYLYNKEKENLAYFKKHTSYFVSEETVQFALLKKCEEFLNWLQLQIEEDNKPSTQLETEKILKSEDEFAETNLQVSNHENNLPTNNLLDIFHKMIKGNLKPHLINEDNLSAINDLLKTAFYFDEKCETLKTDDKYWSLTTESGQLFEVSLDPDNPDNNTIKLSPDESLETLINLNIPPPPDEKSEAFLNLIERENILIKATASSFLKDSNSTEENKLFALKNIQLLKELAEQLHLYIKKLGGEHGNLFITDANHFISYVLKYYLIDTIQFFQQTFQPFTNKDVESSTNLKLILFHESFPRYPELSILKLLPKEKEFNDFKEELKKSRIENLNTKKQDISIGEKLFNFYKVKDKDLNQELQLINYNETLLFWNNLLITNKLKTIIVDKYVNEPEIEKMLIPLLKGEIKLLEKQVEFESPESRIDTKKDNIPSNIKSKEKPIQLNEDDITLYQKNLSIIEDYAISVEDKFITDKDYILFTETLAKFFSGIPYDKVIPIKLKLRSKTSVAQIFNPIHQKIGMTETLIKSTKYFEVIRILEPFKDLDNNKIYRALTK